MRISSAIFFTTSLLSTATAFTIKSTASTRAFAMSPLQQSATVTEISTLEKEALGNFFTSEQIEGIDIEPATGGVSNRMSYITVDGAKYLLRIYNNGVSKHT